MIWYFKQLNQFTQEEVDQVYTIRKEVFSEGGEKDLGHPPMDESDQYCYHSFGWDENGIVCYCRVIQEEQGIYKIARVLVHQNHRRKGMGQQLINYTCDQIKNLFNGKKVILSALEDIHTMYLKIGFNKTGSFCDFNGIPAIDMQREL
ncbi:hypothetical protein, conserved [Entamoeba dispar SAW760]|uniref:N-acetyltransferase domain-containing protein n=1 Tax=Entamoeba dispar (strain ATCC PRA-260 / SAW760) TaxID=370354 RepID=B0ERB6_ENTDS|nr:uncharacterized protein EDI_025150 [Entamoeba dispar SAW760]EDR22934.1 hypothetical protein, conserved [Entamoeba dispar SAW760]|eukprot:EDR22934.1 hypothetical protein, conserved [Entamoeba dispar SAW760]